MIDYREEWLLPLVFRLKGSVTQRACLFAVPAALLSLLLVSVDDFSPGFRESLGIMEVNKSQFWSATTAVLAIMLGFRTNRAMSRFWEGTGLLHQMRGEWFDSVSCCVTFSRGAVSTKTDDVIKFRHTLVRLMSLCHGSALEEIAGDQSDGIETIDAYGLDNSTLKHLKDCKENLKFNRVEVLLHLTQSIITKSLDDGILKIPPPILSRVYQTLSRGFVNLLNAKKIADTRFPFPFAQIITMLLLIHVVLTPIMLSCLISSKVWAPIFTFVPVFGMFYLDFVGVELENPFGKDDNDLPLEHFQSEMNNCLLMLLHDKADLIAGISDERCIMDFSQLQASLEQAEHGHDGDPGRSSHSLDGEHKHGARISTFRFDHVDEEGESKIKRSNTNLDQIETKDLEKPPPPVVAEQNEPERRANSREEPADLEAAVPKAAKADLQPEEGFEASLFHCSIEPHPEPAHPMVQVEAPKKVGRDDLAAAREARQPIAHALVAQQAYIEPDLQQAVGTFLEIHGGDKQESTSSPPICPPPRSSFQELLSRSSSAGASQRSKIAMKKDGVVTGQPIDPNMEQFQEALQQWTQLIEDQLCELRHNVAGMKKFSETVNALQDSTRFLK